MVECSFLNSVVAGWSTVWITWTSNLAPPTSKEFIDIEGTIECGFTVTRVSEVTRRYSQMQRTDKYSKYGSVIWQLWLNCWVFVYELSGCGFESTCCRLNFRFRPCLQQGVPWHSCNIACIEQRIPWYSSNYRVWIHYETHTWHDKKIQSNAK